MFFRFVLAVFLYLFDVRSRLYIPFPSRRKPRDTTMSQDARSKSRASTPSQQQMTPNQQAALNQPTSQQRQTAQRSSPIYNPLIPSLSSSGQTSSPPIGNQTAQAGQSGQVALSTTGASSGGLRKRERRIVIMPAGQTIETLYFVGNTLSTTTPGPQGKRPVLRDVSELLSC